MYKTSDQRQPSLSLVTTCARFLKWSLKLKERFHCAELKSTVLEGKSQVLHSQRSLDLIIILMYSFHILILIIIK